MRAVAEALLDGEGEARGARCGDATVHTVSPSRREIDAQQPDIRPLGEGAGQCIAHRGQRTRDECSRVGRGQEAGLARQDRGPGTAAGIARSRHHEGKLGVELPMLLGQEGAHDLSRPGLDRLAHAEPLLDFLLAGVERREFRHVSTLRRCEVGDGDSRVRMAWVHGVVRVITADQAPGASERSPQRHSPVTSNFAGCHQHPLEDVFAFAPLRAAPPQAASTGGRPGNPTTAQIPGSPILP